MNKATIDSSTTNHDYILISKSVCRLKLKLYDNNMTNLNQTCLNIENKTKKTSIYFGDYK